MSVNLDLLALSSPSGGSCEVCISSVVANNSSVPFSLSSWLDMVLQEALQGIGNSQPGVDCSNDAVQDDSMLSVVRWTFAGRS